LSSIPPFLTFAAKIQHLKKEGGGKGGVAGCAVGSGQYDIYALPAGKTSLHKAVIPAAVQYHITKTVTGAVLDIAQPGLRQSAECKSQI
jgi:hypothetical protein